MLAHYHLQDIIGSSQAITEVKELAKVYGATDSTIEVPPLRKRKGGHPGDFPGPFTDAGHPLP